MARAPVKAFGCKRGRISVAKLSFRAWIDMVGGCAGVVVEVPVVAVVDVEGVDGDWT